MQPESTDIHHLPWRRVLILNLRTYFSLLAGRFGSIEMLGGWAYEEELDCGELGSGFGASLLVQVRIAPQSRRSLAGI